MDAILDSLAAEDMTRDLPAVVKDWLFKSQDARAVAWRDWLRATVAQKQDDAIKRQALIKKHADPPSDQRGAHIRRIAIIDPAIAADFQRRYGPNCLSDPEFIKDCRKKAPELFVDGE